jgi:serine O-acetyltransferase
MNRLFYWLKVPFFIPHYLLFALNKKSILMYELKTWGEVLRIKKPTPSLFFFLIINLREYRSLFYYRLGWKSALIQWYAKGMTNLYFDVSPEFIKKGLVIQHGHSTRLNCETMGEDCQIWHNVTIGKSVAGGKRPVIGNKVLICAGAIVLGDIVIGSNVTIGAGAVITKSIPENCVVVGNPGRIVRINGEKINASLLTK